MDTPIERQGGPPHPSDMEARVAVLETIARNTETALDGIRQEMRDIRAEMRDIRSAQARDFRWLLGGMAALLGVMAHGFHWF